MADPQSHARTSASVAVRIGRDLEVAAAERLSGGTGARAGRRLLSAAAMHGLDVSLMWGVVDRTGRLPQVRQVCLAVPGAGRTAMIVLSGPGPFGSPEQQLEDRVACLEAARQHLGQERKPAVRLAQALPEPEEAWAIDALEQAGYLRVGELAYLRRPLPGPAIPTAARNPSWPDGVRVRNVGVIGDASRPGADRAALLAAMERSYEDTLDCPELCGLRDTQDVLESHLSTGDWNADLWWLVLLEGQPHGCLLLSRCPEQASVELVYLGLSKSLRGKGIGARLLAMGLSRLHDMEATHVACAVDVRNTPALNLYQRLGFAAFTSRVGLVRPL